jgi:hypothetical protein
MSKDLKTYATSEITPTMAAFADFVIAEVYGGTLPKGVKEDDFRRAIALGGSLRTPFQKSTMWQNDDRNYLANVDARRAAKAAEALERAELAEKKVAARVAAARAKAAELLAAANVANAEDTDDADDAEDDAEADAA